MKNYYPQNSLLFFILFSLTFITLKAQDVEEKFNKYTKPFEEVAYTHLNKTTFIKGEKIGFTSYVLNKKSKKPSEITTNLYCVITDENNKIVKQKLLHVTKGTASNVFEIDSVFTGGTYKFKTYTNWMLNFKQQNYHIQTIKILDPDKQKKYQKEIASSTIDAQFLPEGGHILNDVINTIGVIIKNGNGYGVPNLTGNVLDENNKIITTFKLNKLGIGRFSLLAKTEKNYTIEVLHNNESNKFYFNNKIYDTGVNLKVTEIDNEIIVSLVTNKKTINQLKGKKYTLISQNGEIIKIKKLVFNDDTIISSKIKTDKLPTGMNIFTLLDENNQPVSERLFFNYYGLNLKNNSITSATKQGDSVILNLKYKNILQSNFNNVSISVLPLNTKSNSKNSNIISQSLIQPYVKGTIENASYYFDNINKEKKYDLDNLLITQGWSSYSWEEIFNYKPDSYSYTFEQGVSVKANTTDNKQSVYLMHSLKNKDAEYVTLKEGENTFKSLNYFPVDNDYLKISQVTSRGLLYKPNLYVQFFPTKLPPLNRTDLVLNSKTETYSYENKITDRIKYSKINKVQDLDSVSIQVNLNRIRLEGIKSGQTFGGRVLILDNSNYNSLTLAQYLSVNGIRAFDNGSSATLDISLSTPTSFISNAGPILFLNDVQITDPTFFYQYPLDIVDYILVNRDGIGEGMRGAGGAIRIYTDPLKNKTNYNRKSVKKIEFPLTFHSSKKFYVPNYSNYNNEFYNQFGVVDWLPINSIDDDGNVSIKFKNNGNTEFRLFIEGITSEGEFIFEEKTISFNQEI